MKPYHLFLFTIFFPFAISQACPEHEWNSFTDPAKIYSVSYPKDWHKGALATGAQAKGISFRVSESLTKGTNLSDDTAISIETIADANCKPSQFDEDLVGAKLTTVKSDGRSYTSASGEDAGMGHRRETQVFVIDGTSPCIAVRYFIHSTVFENYDPGTIKRFDRADIIKVFDHVRKSIKIE